MNTLKKNVFFASFLFSNAVLASCGGSFCNINTDWDVHGVPTGNGIRLDLRGEYVKANDLRSGSHKVGKTDELGEENEIRTINRNYIASLDYSIDSEWGVLVRLPFIDRSHRHDINTPDGTEAEKWDFSGLGDAQVIARKSVYQTGNLSNSSNAGIRFGLKLPTGKFSEKNRDGDAAERMLQAGSGTVDSVLGAFYNRHDGNISWFTQALWQHALNTRDNYKSGQRFNADAGISYNVSPDLNLLLQLNAQLRGKDSGRDAEPDNSGGKSLNLSPGLSYRIAQHTQIYGFMQQPLYQYVNGRQLTPSWSAAFGLTTSF
jgi:hypothetical protein